MRRSGAAFVARYFSLNSNSASGSTVSAWVAVIDRSVTRGQWYFLRVLWTKDGVSQRELSESVGMMEPTTVIAVQSMEKAGLVRRERSAEDKRKAQVWLTPKAKKLKARLLPIARHITMQAREGVTLAEFELFRDVILRMTRNLDKYKR